MKNTVIRYIWLLVMAVAATVAGAQTPKVEILRIGTTGTEGYIKAEVRNLGDLTVTGVVAVANNPNTGAAVRTENKYEIYNGRFINTNVTLSSVNFYNLEVTLSDGTVLKTPCVNRDRTQAFWWLTDFPYTASGQSAGTQVWIDRTHDTDSFPTLMFANIPYYRGVHAKGGNIKFTIPEELNIQRLDVRLCMQQGQTGNMQHRFKVNNGTQMGFSSPASGYKDVSTDSYKQYVPSFPITSVEVINNSNTTVWANFLIPRLYTPYTSSKSNQRLEFDNRSQTISFPKEIYLTTRSYNDSGQEITQDLEQSTFRIVEGADAATLDGNKLTFLDRQDARVVVEATNWGSDEYSLADQRISFNVRTGSKVFFSSVLPANREASESGFINIHPQGKKLVDLRLLVYNNYFNLEQVAELDLLPAWQEIAENVDSVCQMIPFDYTIIPVDGVFRVRYQFENRPPAYGPYRERNNPLEDAYEYMSDLATTSRAAYGTVYVDRAFGGSATLQTGGVSYSKGFGLHPGSGSESWSSASWVQTNFGLGEYARLKVTVGKQQNNPNRMRFLLHSDKSSSNGSNFANPIYNSGQITHQTPAIWEYEIEKDVAWLRIVAANGGDGYGSDGGAICAPRLYLQNSGRKTQSITWAPTGEIIRDRPDAIELDARSSSNQEIFYRIVKGGDIASIVNRRYLQIDSICDEAEIIVEAFLPGDREWEPSVPVTCTYAFSQGVEAQKGQVAELEGGKTYEKVVVYTDGSQSGEVIVPSGVANVKTLVLRHELEPGRWYSICFPTDADLASISNFDALGYTLGANLHIKSFNTAATASGGQDSGWDELTDGRLTGGQGYMLAIDGTDTATVDFTIDNVKLELDSPMRMFNLTLDLSQSLADTQHKVYIRSSNVRSNILAVNVDYQPSDLSNVPVNHEEALAAMRITYAPHRAGIRLVLPDDSEARVAIYSADGKRLLRAFRYIAPNLIPTADLSAGEYLMAVQYGNASTIVPLTLH